MLQQTQVSRGLPKYLEFIQTFPTVETLAGASPAQVLRMWKGMGYNRRAVYLQKAAKAIVDIYKGRFPDTEPELTRLPGLGRYTARAILVFAFKKDIAMVDTNIRQIITHFFFYNIPQPEKIIQGVADQLVPIGKSWEWHQALMDYGALELVKKKVEGIKKKTVPFKETNRYFRGRMLDLLREKKWKRKHLYEKMIELYGKDMDFYFGTLKGLEKDGLISSSKTDIISLPE
jgi:A/G-specific adenine glycosylase